jgi:hypothetical protein
LDTAILKDVNWFCEEMTSFDVVHNKAMDEFVTS